MKFVIEIGDRLSALLEHALEHALEQRSGGRACRLVIAEVRYLGRDFFYAIGGEILNIQMETEQSVEVKAHALNRRGQSAPVEGVTWESNDETVATVAQSADDPLTATVTTLDAEGTAAITCTADAQIGEGESDLIAVGTVVVTAPGATVLDLSFGTPADTSDEPTVGGTTPEGDGTTPVE